MSIVGKLMNFGIDVSALSDVEVFDGNLEARNILAPKGTVYYVDKDMSISGSGRSWNSAFKTIAEAITEVNSNIDWAGSPWANSDIIYIAPGTYAENLTSMPYGAIMIGMNAFDFKDGQLGVKIVPASGSPVNVGACINSMFFNIGFHGKTTYAAFDADILNNVMFHNCYFSGPVETSTGVGIVSKDSVMLKVNKCQFSCLDKGIDINYADANDSFSHALIQDTIFDQIDTAGIEISSNLVGPSSKVLRCYFFGGGVTMGYAINDGSAILDVAQCFAESTSGFSGCRSVNGSYNNGALVT